MASFSHLRHKPATTLDRPRELVLACAPLRSNINLSRIVRMAGCAGVNTVICTGPAKVVAKIARDGAEQVTLRSHRTLAPALEELKRQGYRLVALEQTTNSQPLPDYAFTRKTVLVVGNERTGLEEDVLRVVDDAVEIPVFGLPHSHNVATAAAMAVYEYCRQFPTG